MDLIDRISTKFVIGDGCWEWTGAKAGRGYGHMRHGEGWIYGHRAVYELLVGPIPEGLDLDHLCRNHACVRPDHLEPVPHIVNCRRGNLGRPPRLR